MDIRKYQLNILCLSLLPLSVAGQEWSKQDALKLQQMLESDQEIRINKKLVDKVEQEMYFPKVSVDFDPTLPAFKPSPLFPNPLIHSYRTFRRKSSTFLPAYSWQRLNKNLILHSKSNFAESSDHFHIQSQLEYKFSPKWSLNLYGSHTLDNRRYRGLPSEIEPIRFGSEVVLKINKNWKIKTGMQYQYNAIRKKWEWIPQVSMSYEW